MGEHVHVEVDDDRVATIRIDRPKVNALDATIVAELDEAARRCATDDDVGAVVVWGGPRVFAAGADIKQMAQQGVTDIATELGLGGALRTLAAVPKVVVAAVNGYALGGGCEVALAADLRVAGESARFGQPEILLGIIPGAGGTQRLARLVGPARAKDLVFTGRQVDAAEALRIGLVDRVVADDDVIGTARGMARQLAAGPFALRLAKQAIDDGLEMDLERALALERVMFAACFATEDRRIGMRSFIEHGPGNAEFTGR